MTFFCSFHEAIKKTKILISIKRIWQNGKLNYVTDIQNISFYHIKIQNAFPCYFWLDIQCFIFFKEQWCSWISFSQKPTTIYLEFHWAYMQHSTVSHLFLLLFASDNSWAVLHLRNQKNYIELANSQNFSTWITKDKELS